MALSLAQLLWGLVLVCTASLAGVLAACGVYRVIVWNDRRAARARRYRARARRP